MNTYCKKYGKDLLLFEISRICVDNVKFLRSFYEVFTKLYTQINNIFLKKIYYKK